MKYLTQFFWILLFCALGEVLAAVIPFPIPAAIYGLVLLFLALSLKIIKLEQVADAAGYLVSIMGVFFVSPVVNVLTYWGVIQPNVGAICVIFVVTTALVFAVSGLVTQALLRKEKQDE